MGLTEIFSDFYAAIGIAEIHAEAPPKEEGGEEGEGNEEGGDEKGEGEGEGEGEGGEDGGEEEGGDEEGGEEEEEEEEEEEVEDPKPKLEEGREFYAIALLQFQKLFSLRLQVEERRLNGFRAANGSLNVNFLRPFHLHIPAFFARL